MWITIQCTNTYVMGVPNREGGEEAEEHVFQELMAEYL